MSSTKSETLVEKLIAHSRFGIKIGLIGFLVLVLWGASAMISSLVRERSQRQEQAVDEISSKWGKAQLVSGPYLVLPFYEYQHSLTKDGRLVRSGRSIHYATFLPEQLDISGVLKTELRHRGIYDAVLYGAGLQLKGRFAKPAIERLHLSAEDVLWSEASLALGFSDLRGIGDGFSMQWAGKPYSFAPGKGDHAPFETGVHVKGLNASSGGAFEIKLNLNGSRNLQFLPLGRTTHVTLSSSWPSPGFDGEFLPLKHDVGPQGFKAEWSIPELARSIDQQWSEGKDEAADLEKLNFGVSLVLPASAYQQNDRAINYAILFILLTFTTFFLFEVLGSIRLHFIHYLLVGSSLVIFFLLLLSFSEHWGFGAAYLTASVATVSLIGYYCLGILKDRRRTWILSGLVSALYAYLYVVLNLEDYSLLIGSIGIFAALAAVMLLTRRLDWHEAGK